MAQSSAKFEAVANSPSGSTTPFNFLDIRITTLDGLSYSNCAVAVRYKLTSYNLTPTAGYCEFITLFTLKAGVLAKVSDSEIVLGMGGISTTNVTTSTVGSPADSARIAITPTGATGVQYWHVQVEIQAYDWEI
jgi:hypothetical protein